MPGSLFCHCGQIISVLCWHIGLWLRSEVCRGVEGGGGGGFFVCGAVFFILDFLLLACLLLCLLALWLFSALSFLMSSVKYVHRPSPFEKLSFSPWGERVG